MKNDVLLEVQGIKKEVGSKHASISESASKKLFNSIVRIEKGQLFATGFFLKLKIKDIYLHCLLTNHHVISQEDINNSKTINIYFGEKQNEKKRYIKLDKKERYIKCFKEPIDVTVIEIINNDNIPENKYLSPDLNYINGFDNYKNKDFYLAGYPKSQNFKKERHCSSGKILSVNNYLFKHSLDTSEGSSGSPICLLENQLAIGIHMGGIEIKKINVGTFIGYILDELNKEDIKPYNFNFKVQNNIIIRNKYFFTLEEYKDKICYFHKIISKYYNNLTENYFYEAFIDVNHYLLNSNSNINLNKKREDFLSELEDFNNINVNYKKIIFASEILEDINSLLHSNFEKTLEIFGYFIAGIMYALDKCGNTLYCELKIDSLLYNKIEMDLSDLKLFQQNINEIISFKTFLCDLTTLEHLHGQIYRLFKDSNSFFKKIYSELVENKKYTVSIKINYQYNPKWKTNCFSVSKTTISLPAKIFQFFSFFRIKNVIINENNFEGEILLDSIPRKEILEEKLYNEFDTNFISYNINENIFEILN